MPLGHLESHEGIACLASPSHPRHSKAFSILLIELHFVVSLFKPWPSHSSKYIKQDAIPRRSRDSPNTRGLDKKWSLMERCRVGRRSPQMPPATRLVRVTPHHGLRPPGSKQRTSSNRRLSRCHGSDLLDNTGHKAPKLPLPL